MKIDTHQHFWRFRQEDFEWIDDSMASLRRDFLPEDCLDDLKSAGVDAVVAVQARTTPGETDFLLQLADQYPAIRGVVGWANLSDPKLAELLDQWGQHAAFKGLRHILQDEADVLAWTGSVDIQRGLKRLQKQGLVYDVLVFERQIADVVHFCAQHDQHALVLDHLGKPALKSADGIVRLSSDWIRGIKALAAMPHVMCKVSGLVTETDWLQYPDIRPGDIEKIFDCCDQVLDAFGPHRLMFGSDWPVCQLAAPYGRVHDLTQQWANARLSPHEQEAFWSGNAMRCYALHHPVGVNIEDTDNL